MDEETSAFIAYLKSEGLPEVPSEWGTLKKSSKGLGYYWTHQSIKNTYSFFLKGHHGQKGCTCDCHSWGGLRKQKNPDCRAVQVHPAGSTAKDGSKCTSVVASSSPDISDITTVPSQVKRDKGETRGPTAKEGTVSAAAAAAIVDEIAAQLNTALKEAAAAKEQAKEAAAKEAAAKEQAKEAAAKEAAAKEEAKIAANELAKQAELSKQALEEAELKKNAAIEAERKKWETANLQAKEIGGVRMQTGNNLLVPYESIHEWAFGAFAELIQNSDDARSENVKVRFYPACAGRPEFLEIWDDGVGMTQHGMNFCFTLGDSREGRGDDDTISGQYGVGFKQGVLRLGHTAVVISRSNAEQSVSVGILSNKPFHERNEPPISLYTSLDLQGRDIQREGLLPKGKIKQLLMQVVDGLSDEEFLSFELGRRTGGQAGTTVYIFGVNERNEAYEQRQKIDFDSDVKDICLTGLYANDRGVLERAPYKRVGEKWDGRDIPMDSSLQEYCKIMFLKPRMKITILDREVERISLLEELAEVQICKVRKGTNEQNGAPITCTIGRHSWHAKKSLCGVFFYTANCLIMSYDYNSNIFLSKNAQRSFGVLAIVSLSKSNLRVQSTKQAYAPSADYPSLLQNISKSLQNYVRPTQKSSDVARQEGIILESWIQCTLCRKWRNCTADYEKKHQNQEDWNCKGYKETRKKAAAMAGKADPCEVPDDYVSLPAEDQDSIIHVSEEAFTDLIAGEATAKPKTGSASSGLKKEDFLEIDPRDFEYKEEDMIGQGRFSNVYRGRWNNEAVAVKVFKPDIPPDQFRSTFRRERWAAFNTVGKNKNVICYKGFCTEKRAIIMELLDLSPHPITLKDIFREGALALGDLLNILLDVADGMRCVHKGKIIHKDLKPQNVLCSRDCDTSKYIVKVADFGISSLESAETTSSVHGVGKFFTAQYSAPEQVTAQETTSKVDVWSFGLIVLEALTCKGGASIWGESNNFQIMKKHEQYCLECRKEPSRCEDHLLEILPCAALLMKPSGDSDLTGLLKIAQLVRSALHHIPESRPSFEECMSFLKETIEELNFKQRHGTSIVFHVVEPGDYIVIRTEKWGLTRRFKSSCESEISLKKHVQDGSGRFFRSPFISCSLNFLFCVHYCQVQMIKLDFSGVILEIDITKLPSGISVTDLSIDYLAGKHLNPNGSESFCRSQNRAVCADEVVLNVGSEIPPSSDRYKMYVPNSAIVAVYDVPASMKLGGKFSGQLHALATKLQKEKIANFREWNDQARKEKIRDMFWSDLRSESKVEPGKLDELLKRIHSDMGEYWEEEQESSTGKKRSARPQSDDHKPSKKLKELTKDKSSKSGSEGGSSVRPGKDRKEHKSQKKQPADNESDDDVPLQRLSYKKSV